MIDKKILSILKENGWNLNIPEITDDMKKNKELILKELKSFLIEQFIYEPFKTCSPSE